MDLIIGAGITGLSYANFCGHDNYLIIEKEKEIGGYCKTIRKDGFIWDYSGHFFHFRNLQIKKFLFEKMKNEKIFEVLKRSQIRYKNYYIDFPFQKNIHQLPKDEFIDCLYDLFFRTQGSYSNFKEMLYSKYGNSICDKFLIPYNEKLYSCDLNELDISAMGRFFPFSDKLDIIKNFKNTNNNSYNNIFYYPKDGAIKFVEALSKNINKSKILLGEKLVAIDIENKIAETTKRTIKYNKLISTIPFPNLLEFCRIPFNKKIYSWNKVLVFNLGFNKKGRDKYNHWVYFPENKYCFYRIGYYDNITNDNRMSLYVEIAFPKDKNINIDGVKVKVFNDLKKAGIITNQKLISYHTVVMNPAYVHINKKSIRDVDEKKKILSKYDIFSIGRYGSWTYCSIEDNIIQAKNLAWKINYENINNW